MFAHRCRRHGFRPDMRTAVAALLVTAYVGVGPASVVAQQQRARVTPVLPALEVTASTLPPIIGVVAPELPTTPSDCMGTSGPDAPEIVVRAFGSEGVDALLPDLRALEDSLARAVAASPGDVRIQYEHAMALGARAHLEGGRTRIRLAQTLHGRLTGILEVDPGHPGASHILGRLHAAVMRLGRLERFVATRLLGGGALASASWEGAQHLLERAERAEPCVPEHHFELARVYEDQGYRELARSEAQHATMLVRGDPARRYVVEQAFSMWRVRPGASEPPP